MPLMRSFPAEKRSRNGSSILSDTSVSSSETSRRRPRLLNPKTFLHPNSQTLTKIEESPTASSKRKWTESEDQALRAAIDKFGATRWKEVSEQVPGRSHIQCLQRYKQVLKPGLRKGAWSPEEDEKLKQLVHYFSKGLAGSAEEDKSRNIKWREIEKYMSGRTGKQCRERWVLSLSPSINRAPWTSEEDCRLLQLQQRLGNSWAKIKCELNTGRTENAVKLRAQHLLKQRQKLWSLSEDFGLILNRKFRNASYDQISQILSERSKKCSKSKNAVRKRWKYLCSLDDEINAETVGNITDPETQARILAERVFTLAERRTPDRLQSNKSVQSTCSNVGANSTTIDETEPVENIEHGENKFRSFTSNSTGKDSSFEFDRYLTSLTANCKNKNKSETEERAFEEALKLLSRHGSSSDKLKLGLVEKGRGMGTVQDFDELMRKSSGSFGFEKEGFVRNNSLTLHSHNYIQSLGK